MSGNISRVWVTAVKVTNFQQSIHFYRDLLGFKVQMDGRRFGWMELGPEEPLCKIGLSLTEAEKISEGEVHDTGIAPETDNAQKLYENLSTHGVRFIIKPTKQPWEGTITNFLDPDGNELQAVEHVNHYQAQAPPEAEDELSRGSPCLAGQG